MSKKKKASIKKIKPANDKKATPQEPKDIASYLIENQLSSLSNRNQIRVCVAKYSKLHNLRFNEKETQLHILCQLFNGPESKPNESEEE